MLRRVTQTTLYHWIIEHNSYDFCIMTTKTLLLKNLFQIFSLKRIAIHSNQLDATDTISSTRATSKQVIHWTLIITLSSNRAQIGRGWLMYGSPSTYVGNREEGMSYEVRMEQPLLRLKIERKESRIESELHRGHRLRLYSITMDCYY